MIPKMNEDEMDLDALRFMNDDEIKDYESEFDFKTKIKFRKNLKVWQKSEV